MGVRVVAGECTAKLQVTAALVDPTGLVLGITAPHELHPTPPGSPPVVLPPATPRVDEFHPFLRPFDWYTGGHGTEVGDVTLILLQFEDGVSVAPFSVVVTAPRGKDGHPWLGDRKLILYPGWGASILTRGPRGQESPVFAKAHHITVIGGASGDLTSHITQDRAGVVKHSYSPSKSIRLSNGLGKLVGAFLFKEPSAIPRSGKVIKGFKDRCNPPCGGPHCEAKLASFLKPTHPVLRLSRGVTWRTGHHLRINVIVSPPGRLEDQDYPILIDPMDDLLTKPTPVPNEIPCMLTKLAIPQHSTATLANLVLGLSIAPGELKRDIFWV